MKKIKYLELHSHIKILRHSSNYNVSTSMFVCPRMSPTPPIPFLLHFHADFRRRESKRWGEESGGGWRLILAGDHRVSSSSSSSSSSAAAAAAAILSGCQISFLRNPANERWRRRRFQGGVYRIHFEIKRLTSRPHVFQNAIC